MSALRSVWLMWSSADLGEVEPFSFPITAFSARQDDMVYTDEISEWSQHTSGRFRLIEVDGDHWFLNRNRALIIATFTDIANDSQVGSA